jgi:ABC-2 type transport system ATP-binding protein
LSAPNQVGIVVDGLQKRFGQRLAVDNVSFTVSPGEVFGLLGPNGAGKTTTVRMLTGLLRPTAGRATVAGIDLPLSDEGTALRSRVGLLTESPGVYDRLTAKENLEFTMRLNRVDLQHGWKLAERYCERLGLEGRENEPVGGFSKGMRQKLAIVRTLLHEPPVLFFDEPTSGLDPLSAKAVRELIAELATQGRTVVLCSHNLAEVERLCARVAVVKTQLRLLETLATLRGDEARFELRLAGDVESAARHVAAVVQVTAVQSHSKTLDLLLADEADAPAVLRRLAALPIDIVEFRRQSGQLERAYLKVVSEDV